MASYLGLKKTKQFPRLPLEGALDVTYRCNNNCRHCWLRIPADSDEKQNELSFEEIKKIVDDARNMGCRRWFISGGEPMLRPDFSDVFDYVTRNSISYSINTNGTLITPQIARLMKRKGVKMVALYGATSEAHDHITRSPGSFDRAMQGFAYLKEAGAGFMVQLIPMKDNYHQFQEMVSLADSLSKHYRIGAPWLYLSACGDPVKNKEIFNQRLEPRDVIELDKPDLSYGEAMKTEDRDGRCRIEDNGYLFASCISGRREFHIDPYGQMSFCCYIKDPDLRYDIRRGSFEDGWENFIPSLASKVRVEKEYLENCGSCELRRDCRWCPVYGYLEHGRFSSKVGYLCGVAEENRKFKDDWIKNHRRYYRTADMTIQVDSDLPIEESTFHPKFKDFETNAPAGDGIISIRHHFSLPHLDARDLGKEVYRKKPWVIYKKGNSWIYGIPSGRAVGGNGAFNKIAVFNSGHTSAKVYSNDKNIFLKGNIASLSLLTTDQIFLGRVLADRDGCYFHSSGVSIDGKGLLFAGHSEAGKSTIVKMLKDKAKILCDDRMIIRKAVSGERLAVSAENHSPTTDNRSPITANRTPNTAFKIYGTWSHGEVPDVSSESAPLKAILFLSKSDENRIELLKDKKDASRRLLACLIRPFVTADWWEKTLSLIENISREIPCYSLYFDKSGRVADLLIRFAVCG